MFFSLYVKAKSKLLKTIRNHQKFLTNPKKNQNRLTKKNKIKLFYKTNK